LHVMLRDPSQSNCQKCKLHVSDKIQRSLRLLLWQISGQRRYVASSRPQLATGDGTTGTFHESHSKRHANTLHIWLCNYATHGRFKLLLEDCG